MSGEVTVVDGELHALGGVLDSLAAAVRDAPGPDAVAAMRAPMPGSHVSWVAEQISAVMTSRLGGAGSRVRALTGAARSSSAGYEQSDAIPRRLFDRLGG